LGPCRRVSLGKPVKRPPGRQIGLGPKSLTSESVLVTGSPAATHVPVSRGAKRASRLGRLLPRVAIHNVWMVVLLVIMVGKVGDWVPLVSGLPVLKIAFVIAAVYVSGVRHAYGAVKVTSLRIARPALAFLTLSIVSILFSIYKSNTLFASYLSVIYLLSFVMLVKTTQTFRDIERLLIGLGVAGSSLSIAVLLDYHGGRAHINRNFDPNDLAYALVTLLPVVLALRGPRMGLRRSLITLLALVMCAAVLLTGSRGGLLGLGVVILLVCAFPLSQAKNGALRGFSPGSMLLKLGLLAVLGAAVAGHLPEDSRKRLDSLIHLQDDYNASTTLNSSRRVIWMRDIRLAFERPIGYGMAAATRVDGINGGQYRTAHNSVIQSFVELGALGLYLFLASYYITWKELGRITQTIKGKVLDADRAKAALYARALRIALVGNFSAGFFLSQAYGAPLWMMVAVCCAFVRVVTENDQNAPIPQQAPGPRWKRARLSGPGEIRR
jgi:O-antigen ligase